MIKRKESKIKIIIEYAIIIATFYVTGGAFSYINYSMQIIAFFLLSFLFCMLYNKDVFKSKRVLFVITLMSVFIMIPCLVFRDSASTYIAIIMQLYIGLFCATFIPRDNYIKKFVNVIVAFAIISLIGFTIGIIYPSFALMFPLIDSIEDASVVYYNAYIYIFMASKGYSSLVLTVRNAGICWEPGCYQMFLNIALFFLLEKNKDKKDKFFYTKFLILVVTIITTVSTTGFFLMILILLIMRKTWLNFRGLYALPIIAITVFFALNFFSVGNAIIAKIKNEISGIGSSTQNIFSRISLDVVPFIFTESYFFGMGFSNWLKFNHSLWNSIIHSFLCLGIPFSLIHLFGLYKGSKALAKKYWLLFIIIIVCASTETLFWRVLFNTFAFYGWFKDKNDSKSTQELINESFNNRCSNV